MSSDFINALWELAGASVLIHSIYTVLKDKDVKGIGWQQVAFFTTWGLWNVYFYPDNGLYCSFYAGMLLALCNLIYFILLVYYKRKAKLRGISTTNLRT
jgi:hypothetical protein